MIKSQIACLWTAPAAIIAAGVGFYLTGLIPPPSPDASAAAIQEFYRHNADQIRIGLLMCVFAVPLLTPFQILVFDQMKRIEGRFAPLAYTMLVMSIFNMVVFLVPVFLWLTAAFRPDRDAGVIQALNDVGWLFFTGCITPGIVMALAIGLCAFQDQDGRIFPRWVGYLDIGVALLSLPAVLCVVFPVGPFAWNGLLGFWVPLAAFGAWIPGVFLAMRTAIGNQDSQDEPAAHQLPPS